MPIQYVDTISLEEIERKIAALESRFSIPSATFMTDESTRDLVPEFDAIEWEFLLMQRSAVVADGRDPSWRCATTVGVVEDARSTYDLIAA